MKDSAYSTGRRLRKEEAQARFLAHLAEGSLIKDALKSVGRTQGAYEQWRAESKAFREKTDMLKARRKIAAGETDGSDSTVQGLGFIERRKLYFDHDSPDHHLQMIQAVEGQEADSISLVLGPPESAKSSLLVDWINDKLGAQDPNYRICIISESRDLSRKLLGQVQDRMTNEHLFHAFINAYGPFKAPTRDERKGWNSDYLTVLQANHDEKEPSVEARGAGSRIYGGRYDKIHLDDIQSLETLNKTRQLLDYIRQTLVSRLHKGVGSISMWGSRVGTGDIYAALLEANIVDHFVKIPALRQPLTVDEHFYVDKRNKVRLNPDCPEVSYWPEYWSMLDLANKRYKVGERVWDQTYMQKPVSNEGAAFPLVLVQSCLDRRRPIGKVPDGLNIMCSLDPALSGAAAFATWAYDATHLYLVDMEAHPHMGNNENILRKMSEITSRYRPGTWVIETDGGHNKGFVADERLRELSDAFKFHVQHHQTTGNKMSHAFGVASMASSFARQEIVLPYADDDDTRRRIDPFVAELVAWRSDVPTKLLVQDRVMSAWFAWRHWINLRNTLGIEMPRMPVPSWLAA